MTTGTTAVAFRVTSAVGPVGFLTRPIAVSSHCHFHVGFAGTLTSAPDQLTELAPAAVARATAAPVAYVPGEPPVQPVKLVDVIPVQVTTPEEPTEIVFEPAL